jgi:hypothetical protein
MSDLEAIRRAVIDRRSELARMLDALNSEVGLLQRILGALDAGAATDPAYSARRPPAPSTPTPRPRRGELAGGRAAGPRSRRTRAEQTLELISAKPGITPAELGAAMELHPQYLYRLLPQLAKTGHVLKRGRGYRIAGDAPEHDPAADARP